MAGHMSREYRIYLALWRKAYFEDEPLVVTAPNLSMGVAMRQGMYRAIRPFREGKLIDEDLKNAADKLVVYLVKGDTASDPHYLEFRKRMTLSILEQNFDALGIDEIDLAFGDERKTFEDLQTLMDEAVERKSTPFYSR